MQRSSLISLRPAWQEAVGSPCPDAQAAYGCVDWYLYQSSAPAPADSTGLAGPAFAAPCSSIIERAVAAAGAAVARTPTPSPA